MPEWSMEHLTLLSPLSSLASTPEEERHSSGGTAGTYVSGSHSGKAGGRGGEGGGMSTHSYVAKNLFLGHWAKNEVKYLNSTKLPAAVPVLLPLQELSPEALQGKCKRKRRGGQIFN